MMGKEAVIAGEEGESLEGKKIVLLHKEWLEMTWKGYSPKGHKALAEMYLMDERFTAYYDREVKGCGEFLKKAVDYWIERL